MKRLELTKGEARTLRDMGIFHSHPRTRMRAQAIVRLSQGLTLQQVADEFDVHLNSVEKWRQRWNKSGLVGLQEGTRTGRPPKWNELQRQALRELAESEGGTASALLRHLRRNKEHASVSEDTIKRYLRQMNFSYKRCRYSLKKNETRMPLRMQAP
jgi:transposase